MKLVDVIAKPRIHQNCGPFFGTELVDARFQFHIHQFCATGPEGEARCGGRWMGNVLTTLFYRRYIMALGDLPALTVLQVADGRAPATS